MSSDLFFIVSSRAFTLVCHVINILLHTALVRSIGMQQAAKLKRQEWSGDLRRSSPVGLRSDGVETPPLLDATSYLPEQISYTDALRCLSCCGMIGYSLLVTLVVWITPYILSWAGTFPVRPTRHTHSQPFTPLTHSASRWTDVHDQTARGMGRRRRHRALNTLVRIPLRLGEGCCRGGRAAYWCNEPIKRWLLTAEPPA